MPATEAFSRVIIDAQLADQGWKVADGTSVRFEHTLPKASALITSIN